MRHFCSLWLFYEYAKKISYKFCKFTFIFFVIFYLCTILFILFTNYEISEFFIILKFWRFKWRKFFVSLKSLFSKVYIIADNKLILRFKILFFIFFFCINFSFQFLWHLVIFENTFSRKFYFSLLILVFNFYGNW